MAMTASSIQAGFEPIPGYVLRNKLGEGGYGEVWLADAPGGLMKAIKFVHGAIEGDRAAGELKSLQRIRQVNHPFILSLERIEVIDGQLIIVTELAQGSLHDRYLEFREKGFIGIAKEKLIGYLKDTADGLDFLCQQHDLQHLDVKPANLLLVADRVKVADFGLIKDIQSNSLSVMGGLTPTYAAPEMFDGRPGRFSDQYSLAIVYQELLSGTLPFRGRTTAQLANEHLHKAPNLEAIPLLERPILSKALSKKPQMRFSDCREFIHAIEKASQTIVQEEAKTSTDRAQSPKRVNLARRVTPRPQNPDRNRYRSERIPNVSTESSIAPSLKPKNIEILPSFFPTTEQSEEHGSDSFLGNSIRKSLTIGLGATGAQSIIAMRQKLFESNPERLHNEQLAFLIIDSDQATMEIALDLRIDWRIPYHAAVLIPLKPSQYYRLASNDFPQLSRRWVYNIPRSLKTEGVRPLGMLALLDNAELTFEALREAILEIAKSNGPELVHEPIEVRIASSAHGGTGSAIVSEIGFMVRQLAAELEIPIGIELVLTCATPHGISSTDLTTASALACLNEINHYFRTEGLHPQIDQIPPSSAINKPPFDHVSLIYGGQCGNTRDWEIATLQVSDYLWACNETDLGSRIASTRVQATKDAIQFSDQSWTSWLGTVNSRHLEMSTEIAPDFAACRLCLRAILPWLSALSDLISARKNGESDHPSTDAKFLGKMDCFVQDLFRNNHWTAQAWVRDCMIRLVPNVEENKDSSESSDANQLQPSIKSIEHMNPAQLEDLEHLCDQLAINVNNAASTISKMVSETQDSLTDWLTRRWLTSPLAWSQLNQVLRLVASKFSVNSNSLFVVSEKLAANHDAFLDKINSQQQSLEPGIDTQLHAMALEARFHSMGAKMLARMAEHVAFLEDIWQNECQLLYGEVCKWVDELTLKLDVCLNGSAQSQSFLAALLKSDCDDAASKDVRKSIQELVSNRLREVVGTSQKPSMENPTPSVTFESILTTTTQLFKSTPTSTDATKDDVAIHSPGQPADVSKTTPVSEAFHSKTASANISAHIEPAVGTMDKQDLSIEIDSTRPYFLEFGGAVRNVILTTNLIAEQLDPTQKELLEEKKVSLFLNSRCQQTTILCLAERLVLSEIMDRVWMPSTDIWNLASRIASRVDVDWLPVNG